MLVRLKQIPRRFAPRNDKICETLAGALKRLVSTRVGCDTPAPTQATAVCD